MMAGYTDVNLKTDVKDMAPQFGMTGLEARFARTNLELEKSGISYFKIEPEMRMPFGHRHTDQEEIYLVISGSARIKIDDEELDLKTLDAIRLAPGVVRALESGPEGAEVIAFGAPSNENKDVEMLPGWWE
jgi:mannose-6-phosphate isomerase-like protein (cupin superfamily)